MSGNVQFSVTTPDTLDQRGANIEHALSLGLPEADDEPIFTLNVIANGPSARLTPNAVFAGGKGPTLALNGSLAIFSKVGCEPDFWAACDPQAAVADFLPTTPSTEIEYLVASKCHPSVFERLKGCDVRLWHMGDHELTVGLRPIKPASTITLTVLPLMRRRGFRHFEIWGWDACYDGLKHHASEADLSEPDPEGLTLMVGATQRVNGSYEGGRPFYTTKAWALEAQDALIQLQHADYTVNLHGDGLVKAILAQNRG